ncbi:MAG: hypothetical protein WCA37_10570 [Terracidiphilus sp.]
MKLLVNFKVLRWLMLVALLLPVSSVLMAQQKADSPEINKVMNQARDHATLAYDDSADLVTYVRSHTSWESCSRCLQRIKDHAGDLIKDYTRLQELRPEGSPWQQESIDRLDPQLRSMANNLDGMITHLNKFQAESYMPTMREFADKNLKLMTDARKTVCDCVDYGKAKATVEKGIYKE